MPMCGCLLEVGAAAADGTQTIVTCKSLEVSLELNADGNIWHVKSIFK